MVKSNITSKYFYFKSIVEYEVLMMLLLTCLLFVVFPHQPPAPVPVSVCQDVMSIGGY
jgi:hypothetical protein